MTEPNRQSGENEERIIEIEIERLRPFKEHPFQVKDDKEMFLLQESIEKYGILNPLIVRPVPDRLYAKPWYDDDQCTGLFRFRVDTCAGRISACERTSAVDQDHSYSKEKTEPETGD